jgi:hypothetical protein
VLACAVVHSDPYLQAVYFFWIGLGASLAVMSLLPLPMETFYRRMFGLGVLAVLLGAVPFFGAQGC